MAREGKASTLGSRSHELIRADILAGKWMPGERLQPALLSAEYKTSTTVVREALTRLAGEKLVRVEPNRGFFVPPLSLHELRDLTELRCVSEGLGLRWAIERGDLTWESELMAAHHTLNRTPRRREGDPEHIAETWSAAHRAFHTKLIEASGVETLIVLASSLADATELYRRWAAPSTGASNRDVESEHSAILDAVLARDAAKAAQLLREHYETTVKVVLESGLIEGIERP